MCKGASIQACHATHHHILAFEEDKDIFDALLAPVIRSAEKPPSQPPRPTMVSTDLDDEDVPA